MVVVNKQKLPSPSDAKRQITMHVSIKMFNNLSDIAQKAGMATGTYAKFLLEAAYTARCRETGDVDLDTAVARVAILTNQVDTAEIARLVGLSEPTVIRIQDAWKSEVRGIRHDEPELQDGAGDVAVGDQGNVAE